jgi:putative ABC transport system permease protein
MMWRDLLFEAIRNTRAHWLRVLLTSSGIIWGIALFVVMVAMGDANQRHYREKMEVIGRKVIWTIPGSIPRAGTGEQAVRRVELDVKDPPRLPGSPLIERAEPELLATPRVLKGGGHIKVVWVLGVGPHTTQIRNYLVARGRFITPDDVAQRRRVLVIGAKVAERLFGRRSALGQMVRLEGQPFRIVGVSVPKGEQMSNMGPRDDEQVLLPITTAQILFTGTDHIDYMIYEPRSRDEGAASVERVRTLIGRHHYFSVADEEALAFFNIWDAIKLIDVILAAIVIFLSACGVLTLAVGAVGVMNIMLVSVTERTREIGLRKALGATPRDLFVQFVFETTIITVAAGVIGVGLGAAIIYGLQSMHQVSGRVDFLLPRITFPPRLALLSFIVLVGTGILAGILPALRAARLDPAEALREE